MGLSIVKPFNITRTILLITLGIAAAIIMLPMCVPPPPSEEELALTEEELKRRQRECDIALSNAWEYYKNREFESSVRNYHKLVDLGCGEENAQDVYLYFGRAYIELGSLDSAVWAFKQGLRYLPKIRTCLRISPTLWDARGMLMNRFITTSAVSKWIQRMWRSMLQ